MLSTAIRDADARGTKHGAIEVRVWLQLVSCIDIFERELRRRLAKSRVSLARFEVLGHLDRFTDGLSMRDLSERLMVSKGNVSGLIARMEREGLLNRATDPEDRRVQIMRLSGRGKAVFDAVKPIHHEGLRMLMRNVESGELATLYDLLSTLKTSAANNKPRRAAAAAKR
jgi:DNA-binding MarR family transcriptional regulator